MSRFNILPPALVVGRDQDTTSFFAHLSSLAPGWAGRIAFDTETTGLDVTRDVPVFGSVSDGVNRWLLTVEQMMDDRFSALMSDPTRCWVMANAKFDMHMLANIGVPELRGDVVDVVVMCALVDENRRMGAGMGLKEQARDFLGIKMRSFAETFDIKVKESDTGRMLLTVPIDKVAAYATLDAYATWHLSEVHNATLDEISLPKNLRGYHSLSDYYFDLEMPFTKTLWRMERRGFHVDGAYLGGLAGPMEARKQDLALEINRLAKRPINPASPAQLKDVLYGEKSAGGLGLRPTKYTDAGQPSTDEEVLSSLAKKVPLASKILEWRGLAKILGTYVGGLQEALTPSSRIHCRLNQTGTVTGRLSSSQPNLQNIPAQGDVGHAIRTAFTADAGCSLIVCDYSQMEMCIMAHMSADETMIQAIADGLDLHSFTASRMLGVTYDDVITAKILDDAHGDLAEAAQKLVKKTSVRPEDVAATIARVQPIAGELIAARRAAKAIGFGLMYGKGPGALAEDLGITRDEAKERISDWFATFPRVREYIDALQSNLASDPLHAVYTVFGRPRRLHGITSSDRGVQAKAMRDAVNAPIQGSASCITKLAMLLIDRDPELGGDCLAGGSAGCGMILQVHDEIILNVVADKTDEEIQCLVNKVRALMQQAAPLRVPLGATGGAAQTWAEAK
jgi:DNA polymerase-1